MDKNKLHNIKNTGFKAPDGYFDDLEDSIVLQLKLQKKLDSSGFKTPDKYFDSLEDKILDKVKNEPKVISLFSKRNLLYASSIAAAIVILFGIFLKNDDLSFDDLEITSIENYLYDEDFDSYEIASMFTVEELSSASFVESELSEDIIQDYLLENVSIEDLLIE